MRHSTLAIHHDHHPLRPPSTTATIHYGHHPLRPPSTTAAIHYGHHPPWVSYLDYSYLDYPLQPPPTMRLSYKNRDHHFVISQRHKGFHGFPINSSLFLVSIKSHGQPAKKACLEELQLLGQTNIHYRPTHTSQQLVQSFRIR
ncbi:uncharacterized protein N7518_000221 [Penicillium psychrosexuale]|uniref:uncharacterized protein n=1 Tax=Penicillium psychrosexuale TaxID=1002107 RepID=UPI002544F278|nr:uncharacterized protein N7518_000221 [Penicillium psychrosexuale]KAJ5803918.1 hypothetical protein N7518_000221 [Penicillium psychrosexuale]